MIGKHSAAHTHEPGQLSSPNAMQAHGSSSPLLPNETQVAHVSLPFASLPAGAASWLPCPPPHAGASTIATSIDVEPERHELQRNMSLERVVPVQPFGSNSQLPGMSKA